MIDADYFRSHLPQQITAGAGTPIVEVILRNGHTHRVRSVLDVATGYVLLEAFRLVGSHASRASHWQAELPADPSEPATFRVTVAYEGIVQVIVDTAPPSEDRRAGSFGFSTRPAS